MEEMVDIIDENTGEITGKIIAKKEAHKNGIWHSSVHIIIINKNRNKVLLQKRCEKKDLYANTWDISVGGHISAGEKPIESAKRELKEELGLDSINYEFKEVDCFKEETNHDDINNKEFVHLFIIYDDVDLCDITLQESEVSDAKWFTKEEMNTLINEKKIFPHFKEYDMLNNLLK